MKNPRGNWIFSGEEGERGLGEEAAECTEARGMGGGEGGVKREWEKNVPAFGPYISSKK